MFSIITRAAIVSLSVLSFSMLQAQENEEVKSPALNEADIKKAAQLARSYRPVDEFEAPPKEALASRLFRIEIPVVRWGSDKTGCSGKALWSYGPDTEKLLLHMSGSGYADGATYRVTIPISCVERNLGNYTVENLFGVKTSIAKRNHAVIELVMLSSALKHRGGELIYAEVKIPRNEARALTDNLKVRVEGEMRELWPGHVVRCGTEKTSVDMKTIWDTTTDYCRFGVHIVSMAFIDGRSGQLLSADMDPIQMMIDAGKCTMRDGKPLYCSP